MSLLPTSTFAGPSQAEALWAVAGSAGPGGGVTQLVAGSGITLAPTTGEGVVTITATGGGGGGVSSVTASGAGITATPTTGAVVLANTGVTSIVAGSGIAVSGASGAVTVSTSGAFPPGNIGVTGDLAVTGKFWPQSNLYFSNIQGTYTTPYSLVAPSVGTNSLTGTCGFIRVPYISSTGSTGLFGATVVIDFPVANPIQTILMVNPTGQTPGRDSATYNYWGAVANVYASPLATPGNRVFNILIKATTSTGVNVDVNDLLEATFFCFAGSNPP